ncbi:HEAT repeat domain-containing protein [Pseudomonas sp. EL_65y_Pfl2_R96]|uniref:HEAT repeat domain-containing protein n=1 Tax=Pseudomonas sp. EL_65y_Pfl2_R96 TaxID=3088699 RepID=UPI0030DA4381
MKNYEKDEAYEKLHSWIGDSEESNWTEYSTELVAKSVLIDFKDQQWERLEQEILQKPEYWQQRCAVSLGDDRTEHAIKLLKLLLSSSCYKDVKIIVIYELDWTEVPVEKQYAPFIKEIIETTPIAEIEPELNSLLAKAEAAENNKKGTRKNMKKI